MSTFADQMVRILDRCNNLHGHKLPESPEPKMTPLNKNLSRMVHECQDCLARIIIDTDLQTGNRSITGSALITHCPGSWHN